MRTISLPANVKSYDTIHDLPALLARVDGLCEAGVTMLALNVVYDDGLDRHGDGYDLWAMAAGLAASDLRRPLQFFGKEQAGFDAVAQLVERVHGCRSGMKLLTWLNPSYFWTGSPVYHDTAREDWFQWRESCDDRCRRPSVSDPQPAQNLTADWWGVPCTRGEWPIVYVYDPDRRRCYASVWYGQPSVDFASASWVTELQAALKLWMDAGVDGFVLDDPTKYVSISNDPSKAYVMRNAISDFVHRYRCPNWPSELCATIPLLSEVYTPDYELVADFGLDAGIAGEGPVGAYDPLAVYAAIDEDGSGGNEAEKAEFVFRSFDRMLSQGYQRDDGWQALSWIRMQPRGDTFPFDWAPGNALAQALSAAGGYLTAVEFVQQESKQDWWAGYAYPGEGDIALAQLLQRIRDLPAFDTKSLRTPAYNNFYEDQAGKNTAYGMIRYNAFGQAPHGGEAALFVGNLGSAPLDYDVATAFSRQVYHWSGAAALLPPTLRLNGFAFEAHELGSLPRWSKVGGGMRCDTTNPVGYPDGMNEWMTLGGCLLACLGVDPAVAGRVCKQVTVQWGEASGGTEGLVKCWAHDVVEKARCTPDSQFSSFSHDGA